MAIYPYIEALKLFQQRDPDVSALRRNSDHPQMQLKILVKSQIAVKECLTENNRPFSHAMLYSQHEQHPHTLME